MEVVGGGGGGGRSTTNSIAWMFRSSNLSWERSSVVSYYLVMKLWRSNKWFFKENRGEANVKTGFWRPKMWSRGESDFWIAEWIDPRNKDLESCHVHACLKCLSIEHAATEEHFWHVSTHNWSDLTSYFQLIHLARTYVYVWNSEWISTCINCKSWLAA